MIARMAWRRVNNTQLHSALAQVRAAAEDAFENGVRLRAKGQHDLACKEFKKSASHWNDLVKHYVGRLAVSFEAEAEERKKLGEIENYMALIHKVALCHDFIKAH